MAVRNLEAVQQLSGSAVRAESRPGRIGPISLGAKQTGERRGEIRTPRSRWRGLETWHGRDAVTLADERARQQENTNIDLNRRASPRPYR